MFDERYNCRLNGWMLHTLNEIPSEQQRREQVRRKRIRMDGRFIDGTPNSETLAYHQGNG